MPSYEAYFRCPDDAGQLLQGEKSLSCERCGRVFGNQAERLFDLPGLAPKAVNSTVQPGYESIHAETLSLEKQAPSGWGDLSKASSGKRAFVKHERRAISKLLGNAGAGVVVDVSGGVGNYSGYLAQRARMVIHCELHVPSIAQAWRDHGQRQNMIFARSDYLALPLADGVADGVVCTDTLIRGPLHERTLLAEIRRILKPGGRAVVDFQHLRFQHIQKRSPLAKCYPLADFLSLVEQSGLSVAEIMGIGFTPTRLVPWEWSYGLLDALLRLVVAPSRYLLVLEPAK